MEKYWKSKEGFDSISVNDLQILVLHRNELEFSAVVDNWRLQEHVADADYLQLLIW